MTRAAVILAIAGFDPAGGAALQADIETAKALGMRIVCTQTCNTTQDSQSTAFCQVNDHHLLKKQIEFLLDDFSVAAIKIGLRLAHECHGSGCTLSTALAVCLGRRQTLEYAVQQAHRLTMQSLHQAQKLGRRAYFPKRL